MQTGTGYSELWTWKWLLDVVLVLIIAFHDIPSVIYSFYVVLNCFKSINSLLVDITGIIAHCRELRGN